MSNFKDIALERAWLPVTAVSPDHRLSSENFKVEYKGIRSVKRPRKFWKVMQLDKESVVESMLQWNTEIFKVYIS